MGYLTTADAQPPLGTQTWQLACDGSCTLVDLTLISTASGSPPAPPLSTTATTGRTLPRSARRPLSLPPHAALCAASTHMPSASAHSLVCLCVFLDNRFRSHSQHSPSAVQDRSPAWARCACREVTCSARWTFRGRNDAGRLARLRAPVAGTQRVGAARWVVAALARPTLMQTTTRQDLLQAVGAAHQKLRSDRYLQRPGTRG